MLLNLYPKKPDQLVNYQIGKPIVINKEVMSLNNVNFHIPTLLQEVKSTRKAKLKEYQKTIKTFLMTISSLAIFPSMSMANTLPTTTTVTSNLPKTGEGLPPELLELLLQLLTIAVAGGIIIAAIMLVVTGVGKMFRIKGITQWTSDILKGLFQVLAAVPVVFLIYYLATLLFKGSGWFVTPF